MTLEEYIKIKELKIKELKKFFILTTCVSEPVVYACEIQGLTRLTELLYHHFYSAISFSNQRGYAVLHAVLEYIYINQNKENKLIDTMPRMFSIEDDIKVSFSSDEEAMEFYSSCSYEVKGYK